jgi:hypothetical protein
MNPLRRLAALPLALVLFWTMVVAPWAIARCEHACGETRLHALGAACADDDHCGDHACPDLTDLDGEKTGADSGSCQLFQADDASATGNAPELKTPPPADFVPAYPVFLVAPLPAAESILFPVANAPPDTPTKETHGRGALPLLI